MRQLSHNALAQKAGITLETMPLKDQTWWFGAAPPDLSLVARARGAAWIYTYLHSFYKDPTHRLGSNNLLAHNSSMPNPFVGLQGVQVLVETPRAFLVREGKRAHYFNVLRLEKQGSMSPEAFHEAVTDLTHFLVYAGEPTAATRRHLGRYVLGFLIFFIGLTYLLYREYWRDVDAS